MRVGIGILAILCSLVIASSAGAEIAGTTDKQVQVVANSLLDTVFEGMADENYDIYTKHFDTTMKESISPDRFKQISQQIKEMFGTYLYREYLGFLNKSDSTIILWKGVFDKAANDVLIKLVVSKRGEKYVITGLWFE